MSLKDTIAYSHHAFHLYNELFDDEHVFLELTGVEFQATPKCVSVRIPLEIWAIIRARAAVRLPWAGASDEELHVHVESQVDGRIQQARQGGRWLSGSLVYGTADRPREEQVLSGMKYFRRLRDRQARIAHEIRAMEAEQHSEPEKDADEEEPEGGGLPEEGLSPD